MTSQPLTFTSQPQSLEEKLTTKHLAYLVETLHDVADKCQAIGLQLGVDKGILRKIEKEHKKHDEQLCEILDTLLRQRPLTMQDIVQALERKSVGEKKLASQIVCQFTHQSSVTSSQQVAGANTVITPHSTHYSVFQPTLQPNITTPKTQPHPPYRGDQHTSHVPIHVGNMCLKPPQLPQHSSSNSPTSAPSQPQAEVAQPPSSSQPYSSQLMSVPVTSQAMPGPSPQLIQDVAAPHPLQVGGQQVLQGQPPLILSHEPHIVAQSHTGSDSIPPKAKRVRYELPMAQSHGIGSSVPPQAKRRRCQSHGTGSASGHSQAKRTRQSPMAQYIKYVKTLYQKREVEKQQNAIKWPLTPSTRYINLVCVDRTISVSKEAADECTRAMVCDGSVDLILKKKTRIEFSDIARNASDSETLILVEGAPGVGKSTFAWEFCRRWERGEIAQQYQLVLLFRLRDERMSKAQSLADLIYHSSDHVRQAVAQELDSTQGENTLIILEGFDELPSSCRTQSSIFMLLIQGELLPNATVLVTSRPWATQVIHRGCSDCILQHIEILGFTSDQIEEYVKSVFMGKKQPADNKVQKHIEEVMLYIKTYPQIKASMYIPLNSAIVVSVYQDSQAGKCMLPKTLTELYYALTQTLLLRYLYGHSEYGQREWKIQSLKDDLPQDVYSKLLAISELAYSGISTHQGDSVQLIFSHLPPDFETLGLMQSTPQLYVTRGVVMSHNFLHLTVQEFLAALHISNMSQEKQVEHFQRQIEGRWRVVLRFLAGITKLANISPDVLRGLLLRNPNEDVTKVASLSPSPLSMKKPDADQMTKWHTYNITADVKLLIQHVHWMFEAQRDDIVPLELLEKTVEFTCGHELTPLDYYSLGYCIVHSHSQWVLTFESFSRDHIVIGEEEVRMLVAGANSRQDSIAKVVGLRGRKRTMDLHERGGYFPLSISAEALNLLFVELKSVLHLQELQLYLPTQCTNIRWPNLSGLRVLGIRISDMQNCRLDTLLPHLSLESLTIETEFLDGAVVFAAIEILLLSSDCLEYLSFQRSHISASAQWAQGLADVTSQSMEPIIKAISQNESLPLKYLGVECECTFSDTAANYLAMFIRHTNTLHHLSICRCTFSTHGLLELAQAIHYKSSLQEWKLKDLACTVDGDDEAIQLSVNPQMMGYLVMLVASHISDRGAKAIATALSHTSTLRELDLSGNDAISAEGTHHLVQALTANTSISGISNLFRSHTIFQGSTSSLVPVRDGLLMPKRCWEYATQCPQYSEVKHRIVFI